MSDPIGYNGSVIDYSGFPPCGFCGGNNCEHRVGFGKSDTPSMRFERRPVDLVGIEQYSSRRATRAFERPNPPSVRATVTIRRPDGTTITCPVDQVGEVLEQIRKGETSRIGLGDVSC